MTKQSWRVLPETALGKWSIILIIVMPILFVIGSSFTNSIYQSVPAGESILADIAGRPALALTMLAGMAAGILAFIIGLLAITRQKERAILVYVSTVIGALFIVYLSAELWSPH